jgi:hypothetical protein
MGKLLDLVRSAHIALTAPPVEASSPIFPSVSASNLRGVSVAAGLQGLYSRELAMSIPTIKRSRNQHCALVASLPITYWRRAAIGDEAEPLEPLSWMDRPDPQQTSEYLLAWTVDDLIFYAVAYWRVTSRFANGFPAAFERMPACEVHVRQGGEVAFKGETVPAGDVVQFRSIGDAVLSVGSRAIATALQLESAAERYADADVPAGYLKETGEADKLDQDEAVQVCDDWHAARLARATGFVPFGLDYVESQSNPERLQLIEGRQHSALELARLMDVPPWAVGAPTTDSITYTNGQQSRADLIDFGTRQFIDVIEATLSGPNVTPRGTFVRLDVAEWLRNPFNEGTPSGAEQNRAEEADRG